VFVTRDELQFPPCETLLWKAAPTAPTSIRVVRHDRLSVKLRQDKWPSWSGNPADVGSNYYEGGRRHLISASSRSLPWRNLSTGLGLSLTFVMAVPIGAPQTKGGQVSAGAARKPPETERALRSNVQSGRLDDFVGQTSLTIAPMLTISIVPLGYVSTWIQANAPIKRAREMVDILRRADAEGLNPEDYDGPGWVERFAQLESSDSPRG
jgi:L,D-transpeptidase-like protein